MDIGALRHPYGRITPMDYAYEPETAVILNKAEEFARSKRRDVIETTHLLYALFAAGSRSRALFEELGTVPEEVCKSIELNENEGSFTEEPVPTFNYTDCTALAEKYASEAGYAAIREQDLWWALLHKRHHSKKLQKFFALCGLKPELMEYTLRKYYECPELVRSRSF